VFTKTVRLIRLPSVPYSYSVQDMRGTLTVNKNIGSIWVEVFVSCSQWVASVTVGSLCASLSAPRHFRPIINCATISKIVRASFFFRVFFSFSFSSRRSPHCQIFFGHDECPSDQSYRRIFPWYQQQERQGPCIPGEYSRQPWVRWKTTLSRTTKMRGVGVPPPCKALGEGSGRPI